MKLGTEGRLQMRSPVFGVLRLRNSRNKLIMVLNNLHCFKISDNGYPTDWPHVDVGAPILQKALHFHSPCALGLPKPPNGEGGASHLRHVEAPLLQGLKKGTVLGKKL